MGVEGKGKGRGLTPKQSGAHSEMRRHESFARAVGLELPLLQHWQHKTATCSAAAALHEAQPRFLSLTVGIANSHHGQTLIRVSFTRDSARFAVRSPTSSRGRSWTGGPGARTRHNRN